MLTPISNSTITHYPTTQKSLKPSLASLPTWLPPEIREIIEKHLDVAGWQNFFKALTIVTRNGELINSPALKWHLLQQKVPADYQYDVARSDKSLQVFALNQLKILWKSGQLAQIVEKQALFDLLKLVGDPALFKFLQERIEEDAELKRKLLSWVERSKTEDVQAIAADLLMLLVKADVDMSGYDFKGIRVPGADLSGGRFDHTQFEGADLSRVNFRGAWLQGANLQRANLTGVNFGELPSLKVEGWANDCCYSPDGRWLAVGMGDYPGDYLYNQIKLYQTETLEPVFTFRGYADQVLSVSFSPDSGILASSSLNQTEIKLWDLESGRELRTFGEDSEGCGVNSVHFSPNGETLASGNADGTVELWSVESGERLQILEGQSRWSRIQSIKFSPDGKLLASGGADKTIKLWNIEEGEVFHTFEGHKDNVSSVAFSPNGELLVSGGRDDTIKLWGVKDGKELHTLKGHSGSVTSVQFSPDGELLASASVDEVVKLWEVKSGEELHTFKGHSYVINSVNFSPDGKFLVSGDGSKIVKLWSIDNWKAGSYLNFTEKELAVVNMSIQGAKNLSLMNERLLKQKGASGEPC